MPRGRCPGPGRLFLRDGKTWTLDYREADGTRRHVALGSDRRKAEQIKTQLVHRRDLIRLGLLDVAGQEMTFRDVAQLYLDNLGTRTRKNYYLQAVRILGEFCAQHGATKIRDLRPAAALAFRNEVLARGAGNRTANVNAQYLKAALAWAAEQGIISASPLARVKPLPVTAEHARRRRRALSEEEITRLLAAIDAADEEYAPLLELRGHVRVPQRLLFQTLIETGARWNEARQATWGDLDLATCLLTLRPETTKAKRIRVIPIRAALAEELRALKRFHERVLGRLPTANDCMFLSPYGLPWNENTGQVLRMFHGLLRRAGIVRVNGQGQSIDIHALRHTCASRMARAGVSLTLAQRLLGHSSPMLTAMIYTHLSPEDLRSAVEAVGGVRPRQAATAAV